MYRSSGFGTGAEAFEATAPITIEDGFGDDAATDIAAAQKQYVDDLIHHDDPFARSRTSSMGYPISFGQGAEDLGKV